MGAEYLADSNLPFLVSTEWLGATRSKELVLLDVRSESDYKSGHVPNSVGAPFPSWITSRNGLALELPDNIDLAETVRSKGIDQHSSVIVIGSALNPYALADAARVSITLIYCGVRNVAVLDGGHRKWVAEGRPITAEADQAKRSSFVSHTESGMFVSKEYVRSLVGKALILDARDPEVYIGLVQEPTATRPGHIPTARCLPTPWLWTPEGTHRNLEKIKELVEGVVGADRQREVIVYCGVGGYAAAWHFVLTQGLSYRNVRLYDGSAQEWTRDPDAPLVSFKWD